MMSLFEIYTNTVELRKVSDTITSDSFTNPSYFLNILNLVSNFDICFHKDTYDETLQEETDKFIRYINRRLSNYNLLYLVRTPFILNKEYQFSDYFYQLFSKFFDADVRECVAENQHIPRTILEQLIDDKSYFVRSAARNNLIRIQEQNEN
jgi:uncharacterized protein YdaL